jgi:glucose/arabinose dehydrogenase
MKHFNLVLATCCALAACGDDDDGSSNGGTGGDKPASNGGAGSGATSGKGGSGTTTGGAGAGSGGAGAGTSGKGGSSTAGSGGGSGGKGGNSSGGAGGKGGDSSTNGGSGGSTPTSAKKCVAPTKNQTVGNTCPANDANPVTLKGTLIKGGFEIPVFVATAPGESASKRLFVVERTGAIKIIKDGTVLLPEPFLQLNPSGGNDPSAERGLLGLAFDPNYLESRRFFVDYTGSNSDGVATSFVVSYEASAADGDRTNTDTKKEIVTLPDLESNHNGGMLAFGPDNCLYVGTGDGGGSDDQHPSPGSGQDLTKALAKILRIDVDAPTQAAPGNLSGGNTYLHTWDYGLRNPWRFSFDRQTGDLYIGDVGQGKWEEVDVEPKGDGQKNYGWRVLEGKHCRGDDRDLDPSTCAEYKTDAKYTAPVYDYLHADGNNCVIGGYVYRGSKIPSLKGWYLYGDNGSNRIWAFVWKGDGLCKAPIDITAQLNLQGKVTSFGEDSDGEVYVTTGDGNVYRIDPQ